MTDRTYNVLFLCTGNSARSIMGEAILNRFGSPRFRAWSAGSHPKGKVNPHALSLLRKLGYDISALRSKSWDELAEPSAPQFDFIVTVCDDAAAETCPIWPGHPMTAHWGIPDPAAAKGTEAEIALAFSEAYQTLYDRIALLLRAHLESTNAVTLGKRLHEIGKIKDKPA